MSTQIDNTTSTNDKYPKIISQSLETIVSNKIKSVNGDKNDDNEIKRDLNYLSLKPKTQDQDEDLYLEGIHNAIDRRQSWQQARAQKSFVPSLSVICKYFSLSIFLNYFLIESNLNLNDI